MCKDISTSLNYLIKYNIQSNFYKQFSVVTNVYSEIRVHRILTYLGKLPKFFLPALMILFIVSTKSKLCVYLLYAMVKHH